MIYRLYKNQPKMLRKFIINNKHLLHKQEQQQVRFYSSTYNGKLQDLRFVILEGDSFLSSKSKVLARLNKMGYTTKSFPHILDYTQDEMQKISEIHDLSDAIPGYIQSIEQFVNDLSVAHRTGGTMKHKNNHIFIDASPLSVYPYVNEEAQSRLLEHIKESAYQLKHNYDTRMYYCEADVYESRFRLGGHKWTYEQHNTDGQYDQIYRSIFNGHLALSTEEEIVDFLYQKYARLVADNWFDATLITTDTQQATCALLEQHLDIQFKLPPRIKRSED
jgi:hypothetical protein